jgi:hypothetical protein
MRKSEIFEQLFDQNWPNEEDLVKYALDRHGFVGDDGYYGVVYPSDLDEYQREVEGEFIPEKHVEILYWDGQHQEMQCRESEYLVALKAHLLNVGCAQLAEKLENA